MCSRCNTPDSAVRRIAYLDRQGHFIFVKVPDEYGRYVRTRALVAYAACPACGSIEGVPCVGQYGRYTGSIHADRMNAANKLQRNFGLTSEDIITDDQGEPNWTGPLV